MFIHLHAHSYYSLLDGVSSPEELILAAKKHKMKALALTDHNALYGAVEFYRLAKEYGIKPIIGAELDISGKGSLIFLVKNDSGYRNLCRLISKGQLGGGHLKFQLNLKDVFKYKDGLIVLSGGQKGWINQLLANRKLEDAAHFVRQMQEVFGEEFYLELQHFESSDTLINLRLRDLAAENKIPIVATNNVHFISIKDWSLRRTLHAIDENTVLEKVKTAGSSEQYLKSSLQMKELFSSFPSALSNTTQITAACHFEFKLGQPIFPSLELPDGESSFSWLWKKSFEGAGNRYKPITREVISRLQYELNVIHELGFAEYFLIVKDIVDHCHSKHIPCVGRGSAADSRYRIVFRLRRSIPFAIIFTLNVF
jgi:DNA polymerase III alpha subunit